MLDIIDARRPRTFQQSRPQTGELISRPHGQHFDATIGIVADPSSDLQDMRLAFDKPAKADALDTSADNEAAGLGGRLVVGGSHRLIAEVRGQIAEVKALGFHLCNLTSNL